jgi:hypothetical protein
MKSLFALLFVLFSPSVFASVDQCESSNHHTVPSASVRPAPHIKNKIKLPRMLSRVPALWATATPDEECTELCVGQTDYCAQIRISFLSLLEGDFHEHISFRKGGSGTVEQRPVDWSEAAFEAEGNLGHPDSATTCPSDPEPRAVQPCDR